MKCSVCNKKMERTEKDTYQYVESGLDNIFLKGIDVFLCKDCGEEIPIIPAIKDLHRTLALAILSLSEPLDGPHIKYLRKQIRYKSKDFAKLLGVTPQTISAWERVGSTHSTSHDRLIRTVCLIGMLQTDGEVLTNKITKYLEHLAQIEEKRKIERSAVQLTKGHALGELYNFDYIEIPTTV